MHYSETESNRFTFRMFRETDTEIKPRVILKELVSNEADILILRVPAAAQDQLHKLHAAGLPYLIADTHVEYCICTDNLPPVTLTNHIELVECRAGEEENYRLVDEMIDKTFHSYPNHYYANPCLTETGSREGYKEWVRNCFADNGITWLLYVDGVPAGFFSGWFQQGNIFNAGPGAILPEFEGKLIFLDVCKVMPHLLAEKGLPMAKVVTLSSNLPVQKQLVLAGWVLNNAQLTIHVGPLLGKAKGGTEKTVPLPGTEGLSSRSQVCSEILQQPVMAGRTVRNFDQTWFGEVMENETYTLRVSEPMPLRDSTVSVVSASLFNRENELDAFFQVYLN